MGGGGCLIKIVHIVKGVLFLGTFWTSNVIPGGPRDLELTRFYTAATTWPYCEILVNISVRIIETKVERWLSCVAVGAIKAVTGYRPPGRGGCQRDAVPPVIHKEDVRVSTEQPVHYLWEFSGVFSIQTSTTVDIRWVHRDCLLLDTNRYTKSGQQQFLCIQVNPITKNQQSRKIYQQTVACIENVNNITSHQ